MRGKSDLLDADAVAKGEALGVKAREIVEGYRVGEHRSPFQGFAIEFAQHREYTVGDDIRHLDWKLLARTDRYYIKQYEQDTNLVAHLLVDRSESMAYGSGDQTKFEYAKILAACLAHVVLQQRDAVSLQLFDTQIRERFERTDNPSRIRDIMHTLGSAEPNGETGIGRALNDLGTMVKSRSLVFVISDLFDDEDTLAKGLERLRFQGSEVIVFQVLDPAEIDFSFTGTVKFVGLEGAPTLQTSPASIRKSYLEAFGAFQTRIRRICDRANCHHIQADTRISIAETLSQYLAFRQNHRTR